MAIELMSKIKPKGGGTFAMVDAEDIAYEDGRLPDYMPVCISQADYDKLVEDDDVIPTKPYLIYAEEDEPGIEGEEEEQP